MMIKQYLLMCYISKEVLSFSFEMQADIYLKIYLELSYLVHNGKHEHFFKNCQNMDGIHYTAAEDSEAD